MAEPTLPSKEEMAYMEAHIDESKQTDVLVCCVICLIAGVSAIGLRVWGRLISTGRVDLSDWLAIVALIGLIGYITCVFILRDNYLGRHVILLTDPTDKETFAKAHVGSVATFAIGMSFIKFSVARMYWTIFPQTKFRWALVGVVAFMLGWMVSATLVGIFQCTPIAFAWDKTIEGGTCVDFALFVLISACTSVFTDIVILVLPIPLVMKLNVSRRKKWLLVLTFGLGSSAAIVGIVRIPYSTQVNMVADVTWNNVPSGMLLGIELTVAIFSACLPTFVPLYRRIFKKDLLSDGSDPTSHGNTSRRGNISVGQGANTGNGVRVTDDIKMSSHTRRLDTWHRISEDEESLAPRGDDSTVQLSLRDALEQDSRRRITLSAAATLLLLLASHLPAKKLDAHANDQHHQPTASNANPHEQKPKAASWDPFRRYLSDANSFPDYRAPSGKMGRNNVKGLNRVAGPVNTVSSSPGTRIRPKLISTPTQPRKIRRLGPSPNDDGTTSHYFTKRYEIPDGSPDDIYELQTSGRSSPVPSRSQHRSPPKAGLLIAKSSNKRKSMAHYPDSPDVLTIGDLEEPPPAKIVSDIGPRKRARQSSVSEPHVKRSKVTKHPKEVVDVSEDELTATPGDVRNGQQRRKTNFSGIGSHNVRRSPSKADIVPTKFGSSPKPRAVLQQRTSPRMRGKPVAIEQAITGWCIWASNETKQAWLVPRHREDGSVYRYDPFLVDRSQDDPVFDPAEVDQQALDLQLSVDSIRNADHAATHSLIVCISRSRPVRASSAPIVCLKFRNHGDVIEFLGNVRDSVCKDLKETLSLEKTFENVLAKAMQHAPAKPSTPSASSTLKPQPVEEVSQKDSRESSAPAKKQKLTDILRLKDQESKARNEDVIERLESPPLQVTSGPNTRRTRRSSPGPPIRDGGFPEGWTLKNPGWRDRWPKSLVYPATGKNRATVDVDDIARLDEGEFLNDNIISFYLRYLQVKLERERPEILKKVYIFSSFFFEKLKTSKDRYEGVKSWTAKVDLLSYDYIVVPVNENAHWYLAIICNIAKALPGGGNTDSKGEKGDPYDVDTETSASSRMPAVEKGVKTISLEDDPTSSPEALKTGDKAPKSSVGDRSSTIKSSSPVKGKGKARKSFGAAIQKFNPEDPRIITLDSLGSAHSPTCTILRQYLREEARDKKKVELEFSPGGMTGKGIPEQDNYCDCGVFVLGYMEEFLKDPDEASRRLLQKEPLHWKVKPSQLRSNIRELLFTLQEEQQHRLWQEREEKKAQRRLRMEAKAKSTESPAPARPSASSQEPKSRQSVDESRKASPTALPVDPETTEPVEEALTPEKAPSPKIPDSLRVSKTTSVISDEPQPKLISRLKDSESTSSNDQSPESYYSAPTSPGNVEAKIEHHQTAKDQADPKEANDPFVERIPDSDEEGEMRQKKPSVRPSIEIDDDSEVATVKSPKRSKDKKSLSKLTDLTGDIVEESASKKPRYDRIDRSGP